ncbi:zinc metallochaperone AztD [Microbacterium awajiense]|uniref:Zinc metallochaperone AztD n=1 Tax=Microbacterium awajiense TaxID=415214 RepID=A0ABP7AUZ6_9MICO
MRRHLRLTTAAATIAVALTATACATPGGDPASAPTDDAASVAPEGGRVAVAYEGGIVVLEAATLEELAEIDSEEFIRLNPWGDGRTVVVTTSEGFHLLDTAEPALTDLVFEADAAGHVVAHHGTTVLFDDGTGVSTIVDTDAFADGYASLPRTAAHTADEPHHGVSVVLDDGTLLTTIPDRSGAVALHPHNDHYDEHASSSDCPGLHGEGTAADEAVVFGCENGALLYHDGEFVKLDAPDEYGRMGNAYVSETSPLIVGDYKSDPDADGYLLSSVALIDTEAETFEVVDLPNGVQYTWRGIARGPGELAYVLSTDGQIHVLDPKTGALTDAYPVIGAWEGPSEWQNPHPAIKVDGDIAYVTEPATDSVHAVDLTTGEVVASVELHHTPNEIAIALG